MNARILSATLGLVLILAAVLPAGDCPPPTEGYQVELTVGARAASAAGKPPLH